MSGHVPLPNSSDSSPASDADSSALSLTPPDSEHLVGEILQHEGVLTAEQVTKALRIQLRLEEWKPLGTLLVDLGWVTRPRVEEALRQSRRSLSIEQILVNRGLLRAEQLAAAVEALKHQPGVSPLRHLVEAGTITERAYLEAYCEKHELPFVDVNASIVDRHLLTKVNLKYLARHRVLPMAIQKGRLNVAMEQVGQERLVAELERIFNVPVSVWIGEASKITAALADLGNETTKDVTASGKGVQYRVVAAGADDNNAAEIVDGIVLRAVREGASDIHFDPDRTRLRVRFRVDGQLVRISDFPSIVTPAVISRLKVLAQANIAEKRVHQQGRILLKCDGEDIDARASFYVTISGENAVLRLLRKSSVLVGLDDLGFSPSTLKLLVQDALEPSTGMVLVTGPTGSGKTTTLYAIVQRMLDDTQKVITCEDPVEYLIEGVTQCSVADRPGLTLLDSLKSILRQDPDVILVGEIRDRESADMAVNCALTGHKVLSTLHTEDSVGALIRLIQMDIEPFLVASTLTAVVAQRLLRRPCMQCADTYIPTPGEVRALSLPPDELPLVSLSRSRGCPNCHYTGYRGRTGVYELLMLTDALREAILQKRSMHDIRRLAHDAPGFCSLQEDGIAKALGGLTTLSEVIANCPRQPSIRRLRQLLEMYP